MSAQGTQSPPLEATANPDPLGAVNIQGDKQKGESDFEQRKGECLSSITRNGGWGLMFCCNSGVFVGEESGLKPGRQENNSIDEVRILIPECIVLPISTTTFVGYPGGGAIRSSAQRQETK